MQDDIVVIDDDPAMLMLLTETLAIGGFSVQAFSSGRAAIDGVDWDRVKALVTDWMMPEMTGIDVATWARDNHPRIQRMIVTAATEALLMTSPAIGDLALVIAKTQLPGAIYDALDAA